MKRSSTNRELKSNFAGFELLTSNELLQVRGGGDPETKPKDIFDLEKP